MGEIVYPLAVLQSDERALPCDRPVLAFLTEYIATLTGRVRSVRDPVPGRHGTALLPVGLCRRGWEIARHLARVIDVHHSGRILHRAELTESALQERDSSFYLSRCVSADVYDGFIVVELSRADDVSNDDRREHPVGLSQLT